MKPEVRDESVELKIRVNAEGDVVVPRSRLQTIDASAGMQVNVRVTASRLVGQLRKRGITEAVIDRIASLQLEPRERVVRFLAAEGVLATHHAFRRRLRRQRG
jgi:hypothetical protein